MPWDSTTNAGFSVGAPWLPLNPDWPARNVAAQADDPQSMLTLYRHLLSLRRAMPALHEGSFMLFHAADDVLIYERAHGAQELIIALNLGDQPRQVELPNGEVLLSTLDGVPSPGLLRPNEGMILA
jgi:glycosidase